VNALKCGLPISKAAWANFISLLAYMILLIGRAALGSEIPPELRTLLYLIPVLGVAAYVWMKRWRVTRSTQRDVDVRAGVTTGGATVLGESGPLSDRPGRTEVRNGYAGSGLTVAGRMVSDSSNEDPKISQDFIDTYRKLSLENRIKLLGRARTCLESKGRAVPKSLGTITAY